MTCATSAHMVSPPVQKSAGECGTRKKIRMRNCSTGRKQNWLDVSSGDAMQLVPEAGKTFTNAAPTEFRIGILHFQPLEEETDIPCMCTCISPNVKGTTWVSELQLLKRTMVKSMMPWQFWLGCLRRVTGMPLCHSTVTCMGENIVVLWVLFFHHFNSFFRPWGICAQGC